MTPLELMHQLMARERFRIAYRAGGIDIEPLAADLRPADLCGLRLPVLGDAFEVWWVGADRERLATVAVADGTLEVQ